MMNWDTELEKIAAKTKYPIGDGDHGYIKPEMYKEDGVPYIRVGDITWSGSVDKSKMVYISKEVNAANPKSFLYPGDIVISKTGATIGKVAMIPEDMPIANTTSSIGKISLDKTKAFSKYVVWCMRSHQFQSQMWRVSHKSAQPGFNIADLKKFRIPLPPLSEQKKIASILDAADELRQKDKTLVEKYNELTQALFMDMFGDPISNPKGWNKVKMESLMKIVRGGSPRPIEKYLGGTYPWIKIKDGTKGGDIYLNSTKQHITADGLYKTRLLPAGSLIFANCGVSLGFARIITFEGCIHDGWLAFSEFDEKKLNKIFLLKALNSITQYFRDTAPDGTQPNLNIAIMKYFELILPPIKLQEKFEKSLELLVEQKTIAQTSAQKSEELFNSLLQKAFNGGLV